MFPGRDQVDEATKGGSVRGTDGWTILLGWSGIFSGGGVGGSVGRAAMRMKKVTGRGE
jgi:hypothetical protein